MILFWISLRVSYFRWCLVQNFSKFLGDIPSFPYDLHSSNHGRTNVASGTEDWNLVAENDDEDDGYNDVDDEDLDAYFKRTYIESQEDEDQLEQIQNRRSGDGRENGESTGVKEVKLSDII